MNIFRGLPWKWIIPVLLIGALGFTVTAYASALGRADAAAVLVKDLKEDLKAIATSNEGLEDALATADSSKAARAHADSIRLVEMADETRDLERTIRDLAAEDRQNADSVEAALRDLGAILPLDALPALQRLQSAYGAQLTGLSSQIVTLTNVVSLRDERIGIIEGELVEERSARSAADALLDGLRTEIVTADQVIEKQGVEIDALRDAVAPAFFKRLWQNAELAAGAAIFGGAVIHLALGG